MLNMEQRLSCTYAEAIKIVDDYLWEKRMRKADLIRWLRDRDIEISQSYLHQMMTGKRHLGPKFCAIIEAIKDVKLQDGLIEVSK